MINTSPSEILKAYFLGAGVVNDPEDTSSPQDWEVYLSNMPAVKDNVVAIFDRPEVKDSRDLNGQVMARQSAQIRISSTSYPTGRTKVRELIVAIDSVYRTTILVDSYRYFVNCLIRGNEPMFMGVSTTDQRRNYEWSINVEFHAKELSD